ncbi:MAG TPA: hypothetical protein VE890_17840, partial [Thermoguttaceae bacterium]|nr:hypothetical protein [Thermoguttaceae bacterium]
MKKKQRTDRSVVVTVRRKPTLKLRACLFLFGVCGVLMLSYGFASPAVSRGESQQEPRAVALLDEQTSPESDSASESGSTSAAHPADGNSEEKQKRLIAKLIPDTTVLVETPPTVIDLDGVFAETEVAGDGETLVYEVLHNTKEKVSEATIEASRLTLTWGAVG